MPKKKTAPTTEIRVVEFPEGEFRPLFVKASDIDRVIVGLSPKTLANWRSQGIGPRYSIINGSIYHKYSELERFFGQNQVETSNND